MPNALIFFVPFTATLDWAKKTQLAGTLSLTLKRVDDWDREVGFRLIGNSGVIRLLQTEDFYDPEQGAWEEYELYGSADENDTESQTQIARLFDDCLSAVRAIEGRIDQARQIIRYPAELSW